MNSFPKSTPLQDQIPGAESPIYRETRQRMSNDYSSQLNSDSDESGEYSIQSFVDLVVSNRKLVSSIVAAVVIAGVAYAFLGTPIYQADIVVQVEDNADTSMAKSLMGDLSSLLNVKSSSDAEIELIRSRMVLTTAVENRRLYIDAKPNYFPLLGRAIARVNSGLTKPGILGLGSFVWGSESINVSTFEVPKDYETDKFVLTYLGKGRYSLSGGDLSNTGEGSVGRTAIFKTELGDVQLLVSEIKARPGAGFKLYRNPTLKTITDLQTNLVIAEKGKDSGIIDTSYQDPDPVGVAATLNEIGRLYIQQNVDRRTAEAQKQLDFLNGQIPELEAQLTKAEQRYNEFRSKKGTISLSDEAKLTLEQSVDSDTKLFQLQQQRRELLTRFSETHPDVKALDLQIAALQGRSGSVSKTISRLPMVEQDLVRLTRDVTVDTQLYLAVLNNAEQLKLVKAGKIGNVRLVDRAVVQDDPAKPIKALVIALSVLLGFIVAVTTALVKKQLFGGITDPSELEQRAGLNVYATVPASKLQTAMSKQPESAVKRRMLLAEAQPAEPAVESLKSLRTTLQFAMHDAKNNIVMIAGPSPGVGKSFVSANLSYVLATADKRVVLVDADMRKGRLHNNFGMDRKIGLAELLSDSATEAEAIRRVLPNLDFIATGSLPPNPGELLLTERFLTLLNSLSQQYDIVLIDTPPLLAVADGGVVASHAGSVFLVTRSGQTKVGEVNESVKRIAQNGAVVKGVIFNGLIPNSGRLGYGNRYGSYRYVAYDYNDGAAK